MTKTTQRFFEARPESVSQARSFTSKALADWGLPDRAEDIRLCVSELATNALHAAPPGRGLLVRLGLDDERLHIEVHDSGDGLPSIRNATDTDDGGRGLLLVSRFADDWGVTAREGPGKVVWAEFKLDTFGARVVEGTA
ncbi:ATP-binding protein [Streptomyces mayteni]